MLIPKNIINRKNRKKAPIAAALSLALLASVCPLTASAAASAPRADTVLTFSDSGITASGTEGGYEIEGTELTISAAGTYKLTGSCGEGSVKVKKETTSVTLVLEDLDLTSTTTAPLSCNKSTRVDLYLSGSSVLTDSEDAANEDSDGFEGAAIKVKSGASLDINGPGTMTLNGNAKNGLKGASLASVTVDGGTLNITAANNGLACDDQVTVNGGNLNITAGNDGVKAEPDEDDADSAGTITINGGDFTLVTQGDGVQGTGAVTVNGGTFDITTFGGCTRARQLEQADESAKGLKSDTQLTITGGDFSLNTADDAVHSNGDLSVTGGTFAIRAGDDAIHADNDVSIAGAGIDAASCVEGVEGARVYLESGSGTITASDDGINAATDLAVSEVAIYLNGGSWTIDAGGDGLDSGGDSQNNRGGDIHINGGETAVFGSANAGNSALDFDGACDAGGGTLLAVGMNGMAQAPTSGLSVVFSGVNLSKGSVIAVRDSGGKPLYSATATKSANHVVFCSEDLTSGASYTLTAGGRTAGTAAAGVSQGGGMMPGGQMQPGQMPGGGQTQQPGQTPADGQAQQPGQMPADGQTQQPGQTPGSGQTQQPGQTPGGGQTQQPGQMPGNGQNQQPQPGAPSDQGSTGGGISGGSGGSSGGSGTSVTPAAAQTPPAEPAKEEVPAAQTEAAPAPAFSDVEENAWYAPAVAWARSNGVMNGVSGTRFAPMENLDRGMMAQILYNLEGRPAAGGDSGFRDVEGNAWYADAVAWARSSGVMNGYSDSRFGPADPLTRAQTAVVLRNYARFKGGDVSASGPMNFTDAADLPAWAGEAMAWSVGRNLLQGSGGKLNPNDTANRAQVAAVMMRYLEAK